MTYLTWTSSRTLVFLLTCFFLPVQVGAQINGDYDGDGDIDGADFVEFAACMTGPIGDPPAGGCDAFDYDNGSGADGFIDMADFFAFQRQVAGDGPCDGKKRYVRVSKTAQATGCAAKITTHQTKLCGQDAGADDPGQVCRNRLIPRSKEG